MHQLYAIKMQAVILHTHIYNKNDISTKISNDTLI